MGFPAKGRFALVSIPVAGAGFGCRLWSCGSEERPGACDPRLELGRLGSVFLHNWRDTFLKGRLCVQSPPTHRIIESFRLEKTFKIIKSQRSTMLT